MAARCWYSSDELIVNKNSPQSNIHTTKLKVHKCTNYYLRNCEILKYYCDWTWIILTMKASSIDRFTLDMKCDALYNSEFNQFQLSETPREKAF